MKLIMLIIFLVLFIASLLIIFFNGLNKNNYSFNNVSKWENTAISKRWEYAEFLLKNNKLNKKSKDQIIELLGQADYEGNKTLEYFIQNGYIDDYIFLINFDKDNNFIDAKIIQG